MRDRLPLIEAIKAVASQLIVLHHLAWYDPLGAAIRPLAPALFDWLAFDARKAVQVFFVVAGFLAARSLLGPQGIAVDRPVALITARWLRLAPPYLCALGLAIASAALARRLLDHEAVPGAPTLAQALAHVALLQDVLGMEALIAGAWYVAMEWQLHALLVVVVWCAGRPAVPVHRREPLAVIGIAAIGSASLLVFNRIAIAALTSLGLWLACRAGAIGRWPNWALPRWLGRISYSLFVVHYPVCLLANALVSSLFPGDPWIGLVALLLAWAVSIAAAAVLHHVVEYYCSRPGCAVRRALQHDR